MGKFGRRKIIARKRHKVGLSPGSVVPVEAPAAEPVAITVMEYGPEGVEERRVEDPQGWSPDPREGRVTWINVDGLHDAGLVQRLGGELGLHPLVQEDVVNTEQRPKLEDYGDYLFLVVKMLVFRQEAHQVEEEQVSFVLGPGHLVSFQERPGDVFDPVRERIRAGKGRIRRMGADYLAYALVDAVVDQYFVVLEGMGDWMERVELSLVEDPDPDTAGEIHHLKRELLLLRKAVWPLREVMSALQREETSGVSSQVRVFVRDAYDHTIQVIDTTETLRDLAGGMLDTYLTSVSNRMNEVMKVLTIVATTFIPLTFVAGVYGMNFQHMPELSWPWAYPAVLGLMGVIGGGMAAYFRHRDWI